MDKLPLSAKQETIIRLEKFLQDSVNLEPELELFIKNLIASLRATNSGFSLPGKPGEAPFGKIPRYRH